MLSAIYVTLSLRPNCRQVVQSACHYVQIEQSLIANQHWEQNVKRRCSEAIAAVAAAVRRYTCKVRFSFALFSPFLHFTTWCLFSFSEVKMSINVVICVPSSSSAVVFPLLAMLLFALPFTAGSTGSFLLPALGNHTRSLNLCVTYHGNKCVHSFEDCHDRACLSDFPPHIVRPSNPPPHCGHEHFCWEWNYKWHYCIRRCSTVDVMNVTPERLLQLPRPPLPQRGCCLASRQQ